MMAHAIEVMRQDRSSAELRQDAKRCDDGRVACRILAIAHVLDGMSRTDAARSCGMDRQTLRDWVHRYNAEGIAGLADAPRGGRPPALTGEQMAELRGLVLAGQIRQALVSAIEVGIANPTLESLDRLATALKIEFAGLFE